jgi:hypothetical protein
VFVRPHYLRTFFESSLADYPRTGAFGQNEHQAARQSLLGVLHYQSPHRNLLRLLVSLKIKANGGRLQRVSQTGLGLFEPLPLPCQNNAGQQLRSETRKSERTAAENRVHVAVHSLLAELPAALPGEQYLHLRVDYQLLLDSVRGGFSVPTVAVSVSQLAQFETVQVAQEEDSGVPYILCVSVALQMLHSGHFVFPWAAVQKALHVQLDAHH